MHEVCGSPSTLSPPLSFTSSSSHSFFISYTSSCTSSTSLRAVASLYTPPKSVWTLLTRPTLSQVMSPTPTTSRRLTSSPTQESLTHPQFSKQGFLEDVEYDDTALEDMLREAHRVHVYHSQPCLSVSRRRPCPSERGDLLESEQGDLLDHLDRSKMLQMHRLELSRLIMTEEVYENLVKLLNLIKKNFTALKLKNFNDEINNFFVNGCCSKIWNYVKLMVVSRTRSKTAKFLVEESRPTGSQIIFCSKRGPYFWERASALCKACPWVLGGSSAQLRIIRAVIFPHRDFRHWTTCDVRRPPATPERRQLALAAYPPF